MATSEDDAAHGADSGKILCRMWNHWNDSNGHIEEVKNGREASECFEGTGVQVASPIFHGLVRKRTQRQTEKQ